MDTKDMITEWIDLKTQIVAVRKDISILNKREKELRNNIKRFMSAEDTDIVEIGQRKVSYKKKVVKGSITREVIKKGLLNFFGDPTQSECCYQAIVDAAPDVERESVNLK
jgi:hypothetical protein